MNKLTLILITGLLVVGSGCAIKNFDVVDNRTVDKSTKTAKPQLSKPQESMPCNCH